MNMKWIGAVLIICSCGGFGFYLTSVHKRDEHMLHQLLGCLDYMHCELQYHLTPLPDLCRQAANQATGDIRYILIGLADSLESQISPDVVGCMQAVLVNFQVIPEKTKHNLKLLGQSMGRFDLDGQLRGLESLRHSCRKDLEQLRKNGQEHLRSCQTLGLCAGAALVILFI